MKSAKIFIVFMYIHLVLSVAVIVGIIALAYVDDDSLLERNIAGAAWVMLIAYMFFICIVFVTGWICVVFAVSAYRRREYEKLRRGWKNLKFWTIPFYILNFIYSFFVWFTIVGASRGIAIFLVPIPICITCAFIFQSGCVGWCYIHCLRMQPENGGKPSDLHYILQVIAVLDIISTAVILRREKAGILKI